MSETMEFDREGRLARQATPADRPDSERERFEKWCTEYRQRADVIFAPSSWEIWQARAALDAAPRAQPTCLRCNGLGIIVHSEYDEPCPKCATPERADAARTPLDQPEAVARMTINQHSSGRYIDYLPASFKLPAGQYTLGVLPFTASSDSIRREALLEAAMLCEDFDATHPVALAQELRKRAAKGQS